MRDYFLELFALQEKTQALRESLDNILSGEVEGYESLKEKREAAKNAADELKSREEARFDEDAFKRWSERHNNKKKN